MSLYIVLTIFIKVYLYIKTFSKYKINIEFINKIGLFIPIFIWRVFTADVTNIFIRIYKTKDNRRETIIDEDSFIWSNKIKNIFKNYRFYHVAEIVVLSTIFNQLKYNNQEGFKQKIIKYSKTLIPSTISSNEILTYELVYIQREHRDFSYIPLVNYDINTYDWSIKENILDNNYQEKLILITNK